MSTPSNPLIPTGPHVKVWVVSVQPKDVYQPLAVVATETEALDLCNRIAISAPEQKPRRDAVWIPDKSVYAKAEELANNRNAGVMLRSADEFDPNAPIDPEWEKTHWRDVTPTEVSGAVQIVGGVRPPEPDGGGEESGGEKPASSAPTPPVKSGKKADRKGRFNWNDGDLTEVK